MFERFKQRSNQLERLDTGEYTREEYRRWQFEMCFIHGVFGEIRALRHSLVRDLADVREGDLSILDVGCGTGNLLREMPRLLPNRRLKRVGVDLEFEAAKATASGPVSALLADGLRLPFADRTFDCAYCTLLLHHLDDDAAVSVIREMDRVAARVYIIDLNRSALAYYAFRLMGYVLLQPLTRDDGSLSILRSRTPAELRQLARQAELPNATVRHSRLNRLILSGGSQA
jgi:SAM-dependent methyltransferase